MDVDADGALAVCVRLQCLRLGVFEYASRVACAARIRHGNGMRRTMKRETPPVPLVVSNIPI